MFFGGVVFLFIVAPLFSLFLKTPFIDIKEAALDKEVVSSIYLTISVSMVGTLIFSIFAIPLAYLLSKKDFLFKKIITGIIDLPIVIPHSAAGIAILGIISRNSLLGTTAEYFGYNLIGNPLAIMLAMSFVSIPFLINSARDGFSAIPERIEKTALSLGASPLKVFFTISLPLAKRSIFSGLILMWARGLSEFGAVIIVAYHPIITPVLIYERFSSFGLKYARPVTVLFLIICFSIFILFRLLSNEKK